MMDVSIISNILLKIHPKVCKTEHLIYFFSHITSYLGIIPLDQVDVRVLGAEGGERSWQFEIYNVGGGEARDTVKGCKLDRGGTVVMGHHKVYRWVAVVSLMTTRAMLFRMSAATAEERDAWVSCLDRVIKKQRLDRLLQQRKERHLSTRV